MTTFNDVGKFWSNLSGKITYELTCELGFTLTPDSFISFQKAALVLIFCGLLIVVGYVKPN